MGYTISFDGHFEVTPKLKHEHAVYLHRFSETRRMKRDINFTKNFPDPIRKAAGLNVGANGQYYVGDNNMNGGMTHTIDIIDFNAPSSPQPGLWCKWVPTENLDGIEWNGVEKFYDYIEWLEYIIEHFLSPWGYKVNGKVTWHGEEAGDVGIIEVKNNQVKSKQIDLKSISFAETAKTETKNLNTVRLLYQKGSSNKFWEITQKGNENHIHFGKIGTKGQFIYKPYNTSTEAAKEKERAIREKLNKGYIKESDDVQDFLNEVENILDCHNDEHFTVLEDKRIVKFLDKWMNRIRTLKGY